MGARAHRNRFQSGDTLYLTESGEQAKVGVGDRFRVGETHFLVVPEAK